MHVATKIPLGVFLSTSALLIAGAFPACTSASDDCELNASCNPGNTSSGSGGDGGGGGTPGECVPAEASGPVDSSCGVFVSADSGSDETGDGSQASPYATIGKGLEEAGGRPVYACVADYGEAVTISDSVDLFGGLSCLDWTYTAEATRLNGPADEIAMLVQSSASGTGVFDFAVTAADAAQAGGSSIAVLVDQAQAEFVRCEMTAGDGADGVVGDTPDSGDLSGDQGGGGLNGCSDSQTNLTPAPVTKTCPNGGTTRGGRGGYGDADTAGPGNDGISDPAVANPEANGGKGQTAAGGPPNTCAAGTVGSDGASGEPGAGATGLGTVDATGYTGAPGTAGEASGHPAQGGGGGGGTQGQYECSTTTNAAASGGNGGSGGCGGAPGGGGGAGGSSIALVSVGDAAVSLVSCTLTAANGGVGGQGSAGEEGGVGGGPGSGGGANDGNDACDGGYGGQGGQGGAGGGGLGGHSIGIAHTGTVPVQDNVTIAIGGEGAGGPGGDGGTGNEGGDGEDGQAAEVLAFD